MNRATLVKFNAAKHALAVCKSFDEVKDILDKAEALRCYSVMAQDTELEHNAIEIRLRAERRLGEMIGQQKAEGGLSRGAAEKGANALDTPEGVPKPKLADAGISHDLSARAQNIAAVPEQEFEQEIADLKERTKRDGKQVQTRLIERGKQVRGKEAPAETDGPTASQMIDELNTENKALRREVDRLTERLAGLEETASQPQRELAQAIKLRQLAEGARDDKMRIAHEMQKELDRLRIFRNVVREAAGAPDEKSALRWAKAMAATRTSVA